MRIHDQVGDKSLDRVALFLTPSEAKELKDDLESILGKPAGTDHVHIPGDSYEKEITVCTYDVADLSGFAPRARKLILEDQ